MKNKDKIIIQIVTLSIICVFLLVYMTYVIVGNRRLNYNLNMISNSTIVNNKVYDESFYSDIQSININTKYADVIVNSVDDNLIHVTIYGKEDNYNRKGNTKEININTYNNCNLFCIDNNKYRIEVYIPEYYDKDIIINNNNGTIDVDEFKYANMYINNEIGNVTVFDVNNITLNVRYGDILLNNANNLEIKTTNSNIRIKEVNTCKIINDLGNIKIDKINEYINIKNKTGNINIKDIILTTKSYINNGYGNINIERTSNVEVQAKTELGKNIINNKKEDNQVLLNINNKCGDIEVEN